MLDRMPFLTVLTLIIITIMGISYGCNVPVSRAPITPPPTNYYKYVNNFLNEAKNSYKTGAGYNLSPSIKGISDSDFRSLSVQNDTLVTMSGKQYEYQVVLTTQQSVTANPTLGDYRVVFGNPSPGATYTGGTPTLVQVYEFNKLIDEFTTFEIPFQITNSSVFIDAHTAGDLLLMFMYNTHSPGNYERLWLIMLPHQ